MNNRSRKLAFIACAGLLCLGQGYAQGLSQNSVPAEFPPESFTGDQYVDSQGCAYLRAGVGAQTTWVPRFNREREVICGRTPTFESVSVSSTESTTAPEIISQVPIDTTVQTPSAPTVSTIIQPETVPETVQVLRTGTASTMAAQEANSKTPQRRVVSVNDVHQPETVVTPQTSGEMSLQTVTGCGASSLSAAYLTTCSQPNSGQGWTSVPPEEITRKHFIHSTSQTIAVESSSGSEQTLQSTNTTLTSASPQTPQTPSYRSAWDDGRLNENRGIVKNQVIVGQNGYRYIIVD